MVRNGDEVFVHFAGGTGTRVLHASKAVMHDEGVITVNYAEPEALPTAPATTMIVFFHGPVEFMQQPGERIELSDDAGEPVAAIRLLGEPVSAESRKCFRVGTVLADYSADFGVLGTCKLVDVSAAGVGFLSTRRCSLGESFEVKLSVHGRVSKGRGFIQSVKEVRHGYRYGLLCTNDGGAGGLDKGLQQLTMDAQRAQLRRLSGAA
jgi:hypothetical protein